GGMSFPVLICDDSPLARKQMARSLPASLNADITFAVHGLDAMGILEKQSFKLMFLDLTMPELDGFETLEAMGKKGYTTPVVVVSGDIQPKAKE
ncbi:response regulator, partial [Klebsiella pneumoniae]|uniref:response regulator n=1 Tax=Klebsiella pneumoniae TaxID=573 RepID=UPI00190F93AD